MISSCYLLSSFPTLFFGKDPGIRYEYFLDVVCRFLDGSQRQRIQNFCYNEPPCSLDGILSPEVDFWAWEIGLRNELVRIRAENLGVKSDSHLRNHGSVSEGVTLAREIMRVSDPLQVEELRARASYDWLEMMRGCKVFGFRSLIVYSMQLQILQRYHDFDPVKGRKNYDDMYQYIYGESESVILEKIS